MPPEPRISGHDARKLLGISRTQFQRLARHGHFGGYINYSDAPHSPRYYLRSLVEGFLREREKAADPKYQEAITQEMLSRIKERPKGKSKKGVRA